MAIEYEHKFKATRDLLTALNAEFSCPAKVVSMETIYYDTASGDLSARRYTLRKRLENGVPVCTLKIPAGNARSEWETECESIEAALPKLIALGCPEDIMQLSKSGLVPICGARSPGLPRPLFCREALWNWRWMPDISWAAHKKCPCGRSKWN